MNAPDRFELYLLADGEKKITLTPDSRIPSAATIKFEKEDHTLGNMLRAQLLQDPRVVFAGYKIEHPLVSNFILRVQTEEDYEPREAVVNAARSLLDQLTQLRSNFEREWELKKITDEVDEF